jgi:hypothetical protein
MPVVDDSINLPSGATLWTGSLTPGAPALTFTLADTAVAGGASVAGSITNTGDAASGPWSIAAIAGLTITPNSGTSIAAGATVSLSAAAAVAGTYNPVLASEGAAITGNPQTIAVSPGPSIVLSSSGNPQTGIEYSVTVTAANLTGPLVVTPENVSPASGAGSATFNPTTATPAPGELIKLFGATWATTGAKQIRATAPGGIVSNTLSVNVVLAPPSTATLNGANSVQAGATHTSTVTLSSVADQNYTITWLWSNGGTGTATSTITAGQTTATGQSSWAAAGTGRTVDFTISPSITRAGRPLLVDVSAPGEFTWSFADGATLATGRNQTTTLATSVPSGSVAEATPGLLPGQTLSIASGTLSLVGDNTVPTVNNGDAVLDAISDRDVVIEVMDAPLASFQNLRTGTTYGKAHNGTTWYQCMSASLDGDTVEISPGAINESEADCSNYESNSLDSCGMVVGKGLTIRNIPGRGRWRLFPRTVTPASNRNGIGIFSPTDSGLISGRLNITIEGFDLTDQFLTNGCGVRIRSAGLTSGSWAGYHSSVTLRNFKIARTTGRSLSGISGSAELLTLENGEVTDCANGSGQEHNIYAGGRVFTMNGCRIRRTRGWSSLPAWSGNDTLEGHMLKLSAVTGVIEGCVIDCATLGDQSLLLQMKAGGNWTVRGNVFRDSKYPNVANGAITMLREYNADGTTPNFEWWAGLEGNSLDFQRNVFIGHYPRPIIWFFPHASYPNTALYPAGDGTVGPERELASLTVLDNVAMVTSTAATWMLSGFPGANNAMWINNDPNGGTNWAARGNTVLTYTEDELAFSSDERALLAYRLAAGPVAASGSLTTKRFTWPIGYIARTDSSRGLG